MKVKVGDKIYDGEEEPVMVILTEKDKDNLSKMLDECDRYCCYPDTIDEEVVEKWMKV